ncbi:MAG: hypothetical protein AAF725_13910 [Acidobacteriota bacterium]
MVFSTRAIRGRAKAAVPALAAALLTVGLASPAAADEIFVVERGELKKLDTETGQRTTVGPTDLRVQGLTFLDRDRLLAVTSDGSLHLIDPEDATGELLLAAPADQEALFQGSLAAAPGGNVYILTRRSQEPPRLELLNLETLEVEDLGFVNLAESTGVSLRFSFGLGFIDEALVVAGETTDPAVRGIFSLSPVTGLLDLAVTWRNNLLQSFAEGSQGSLWVLDFPGLVAPPSTRIFRVNPETGQILLEPRVFNLGSDVRSLAIRPLADLGCVETATRKCFLEGRYTAEVRFRDFAGLEGDGRVVPGASDNTSLFWFFAADNWELMVKVLDGCENNGMNWVFLSATTNVEFTVTVTDQVTGESRTYENPLGQEAMTVLDTEAFECSP